MDAYEKGEKLGEGQFGVVIKARHKETGQVVAIKKIHLGKAKEGINMTALREIKLLRELEHDHIVRLLDVFPHKRNLSLVYEYMDSDLEILIRDRATVISPADVKSYMRMVLSSLAACHAHWVLHRDVKPSNFLVSMTGQMKLGDFGLARAFGTPEGGRYTPQVFTRWYRPPELLFGASAYGPAVDIWAAGCVFAELLLRRAWLPGESDLDQLGKIFQALGTPTGQNWPHARLLPQFVEFQATPPPPLRATFRQASEDALALLAQLVALDPLRRLSAESALQHRYFRADPPPTPPALLPKPPVRAHNPLHLAAQGSNILQAVPALHKEHLGAPATGTSGLTKDLQDQSSSDPSSASHNRGAPAANRRTGVASATTAGDNHTPIVAVFADGGRAMLTDERDGLKALGFDVGSSNPRLEEDDLRQLKKRKLAFGGGTPQDGGN